MNKVDIEYQRVLRKLYQFNKNEERQKGDRTGTGTTSYFGDMVSFSFDEGFPILTTKNVWFSGVKTELLWFLGNHLNDPRYSKFERTNIRYLLDNKNRIWSEWPFVKYLKANDMKIPEVNSDEWNVKIREWEDRIKTDDEFCNLWGNLGPVYGAQWMEFGTHMPHRRMIGATREDYGYSLLAGGKYINQLENCIDLLKNNPDSRRIMVNAWNPMEIQDMALPPCFVPGSLVNTIGGEYKKIEDIKKGDFVLTEDGNYNRVYELMETKVDNFDLISLRHHGSPFDIKCTKNHPFLVKGKGYIPSLDIEVGDYISIPIIKKEEPFKLKYEVNVNQYSKKIIEETIEDEREWYLMGYFLGDGWLNKRGEVYLSINDDQYKYIIEKIGNIVPLYKLNNSGNNVKKYVFKRQKWEHIFSMFGKGAKNKRIPDFILNGSKNLISKFIEGYCDADGCETKDGYSITSISDNISFGMQLLYAKIGIKSSLYYQQRSDLAVIENRVVNQQNTYSINTYKQKNNSSNYIFDGNNLWMKVYDKKNLTNYTGSVYNLSVENNHTYTVNNVINHNCHYGFQFYTHRMSMEERFRYWFDNMKPNRDVVDHYDELSEEEKHKMLTDHKVPERYISMMWNQRSVDTFLGLPFNISSYALLLELVSREVNMIPFELKGSLGDVHLYSNHIDQAEEQLSRINDFKLPKLLITEGKSMFDLEASDIKLDNYEKDDPIKAPIAV